MDRTVTEDNSVAIPTEPTPLPVIIKKEYFKLIHLNIFLGFSMFLLILTILFEQDPSMALIPLLLFHLMEAAEEIRAQLTR